MSNTLRPKRYAVDVAALSLPTRIGCFDAEDGSFHVWDPIAAVSHLAELTARPDFTPERYCSRCQAYDTERGIHAHQMQLPRLRPEKLRQLKLNPVALPWEPGKPAQDVHVTSRQVARPPGVSRPEGCHNCIISFLDEVELPDVAPEMVEALKAEFRAARDNLRRLYRAKVHPGAPTLGPYLEKLLESARDRLRSAVRACRDAGVEPARPRTQRDGDEAPSDVVATTWEQTHHILPERTGGAWVDDE